MMYQSQFIEMFGTPANNERGLAIKHLNEISDNLDSKRIPITSGDRKEGPYPYYGASGIVDHVAEYIFDETLLLISEDGANLKDRVTPIAFTATGKYWVNNHAHILRFKDISLHNYVEYFINYLNVEKYLTGMAQPKLNQDRLNAIPVNMPSSTELVMFHGICKQADKSKFGNGFKSQFIEMFGEQSTCNRDALQGNVNEMFIGPFGSSLKNDCFVEKEDGYCVVYEQKHAIDKDITVPFRYVTEIKYKELKRFTILPNDIIVSCRGTVGQVFMIPENAPMGIMHPSIMKIRLKAESYLPEFFVFALTNYMKDRESQNVGTGIKMAVTATTLAKEKFPKPSISEQQHFVNIVHQADKSKSVCRQAIKRLVS